MQIKHVRFWLRVAALLLALSLILFNLSIQMHLNYWDFWFELIMQVATIVLFLSFASIIAIFNATWERIHYRFLRLIFIGLRDS